MAKRKTKEQREAEAKAALRRRVDDLFIGATGEEWDEESEPWPREFMAFVHGLRRAFSVGENEDEGIAGNDWLWGLYSIENYRNPDSATEYLFENGVRADG